MHKIVGGREAALGQFPWMVRLGYQNNPFKSELKFLCGGSLISRYYVLTAAHCVDKWYTFILAVARLGEHLVYRDPDCEGKVCAPRVQDIPFSRFQKYEMYNYDGNSEGDITLLQLRTPARLNDFVKPICLPRGDIMENQQNYLGAGSDVIVAGWGATDSSNRQQARKLQFTNIPVVDLDECRAVYTREVDESQICAGGTDGRDSCSGDSGGPIVQLISLNGTLQYFVLGVVSYGKSLCGSTVAVYTNVAFFMEWILDNIYK
ncbi:phenoloxidase-activating factor 3-like [Cylas formicarius]|uniref:phenoloxidase-activating factor 3-like n=1 Tax=Cylas formicarius TaxID=197179 RepID=UPI0029587ABC|nr:phenoloxidase-activating factor 3-like [Cylas formicarius]